jgi:Plasmid pRiA4b ORF-3-like protein
MDARCVVPGWLWCARRLVIHFCRRDGRRTVCFDAKCDLISAKKAIPSVYQLKITLLGMDAPIWRRIQVPSTVSLSSLHDVLQAVMGWTNSHLHQFEKGGKYWGVPDDDGFDDDIEVINESWVPVEEVLNAEGDSMVYVYDFGDDWRHEVVLEKIVASDTPTKPVCFAGERRCPPEDIGGPHGYQEFLEVIFQPGHEEFEHYREWAGNPVHAEEFDVKAVNDRLSRMRWPMGHGR